MFGIKRYVYIRYIFQIKYVGEVGIMVVVVNVFYFYIWMCDGINVYFKDVVCVVVQVMCEGYIELELIV